MFVYTSQARTSCSFVDKKLYFIVHTYLTLVPTQVPGAFLQADAGLSAGQEGTVCACEAC